MNEELRKLLDSIKQKKQEVRDLCAVDKLEDAARAKEELKEMQAKFDLLYDLEQEKLEDAKGQAAAGAANVITGQPVQKQHEAFTNALKAATDGTSLADSDKEILNAMSEGSDKDGGLTVPPDIRTHINELRRSEDALENLVNVEHVNTLTGSRVIEKHADQTPFDNVDEAAEFPEVSTPEFYQIDYKVKKKGGILKVTQELLDDSSENIINYLRRWISKKEKATRNFMIVAKVKEITAGKEVTVNGLDDLKKIFNISLDPAIALTSGIVTNQDGYNWLDTIKDDDGKYILQPDPVKPTNMLLFGRYRVVKIGNKTLPSVETAEGVKAPFICGDLKEAITIFDRETLSIDISNVAKNFWETDHTGLKVRERLDIRSVDEEAIIMAEHLITAKGSTKAAA